MLKIPLQIRLLPAYIFFACMQPHAAVQDLTPAGAVNDFASILSGSVKDSIEYLSQSVLQKTGVALVLVTVTDLGGADINDAATRLYEKWGIGKKGKDEGALVLLSVKDRQVRIENGYGSEGYITDAQSGRIIREITVPYLSKGNWDAGLMGTMIALAKLVAKAYNMPLGSIVGWEIPQQPFPVKIQGKINIVSVLFFSILVLFLLSTRMGRSLLFFMMLSSLSSGRSGGSSGFGGGFGGRGFGGFGGGMSGGGGATGRF